MSVRAYRVIEIKKEEFASFNLWHDETLNDELRNSGYYDDLNAYQSGGIFEISVSALREIITDLGNTINPEIVENLQKDIKATEDMGEEFIQYCCY